jgi:hypothetical protein
VAVDAALQAAKEAVGEQNKSSALAIAKSETSTVKQIDQLGAQLAAQTKNFDDKIADLKDRLNRVEGKGERIEGHSGGLKDAWGVVVGLIAIAIALFAALHK